jgi:osmotically-inducible protein OsmY
MARWIYVLALVTVVGCDRGPDTEENVRRALDQANMQVVQVQVDDNANIIHLKGTVDTMGDRTRAEEVASAAVGTTGRVLNELTVKGLNDETADDLDDDIDDTLNRTVDNDPVLKERDIEFEVANGMVTIHGEVASAGEKAQVEQLAKAAPGVKDVANGLEIKAEQ